MPGHLMTLPPHSLPLPSSRSALSSARTREHGLRRVQRWEGDGDAVSEEHVRRQRLDIVLARNVHRAGRIDAREGEGQRIGGRQLPRALELRLEGAALSAPGRVAAEREGASEGARVLRGRNGRGCMAARLPASVPPLVGAAQPAHAQGHEHRQLRVDGSGEGLLRELRQTRSGGGGRLGMVKGAGDRCEEEKVEDGHRLGI